MAQSPNQSHLYEHPDALIAIDSPDNRVRAIFPVDIYRGGDGHGLLVESPVLERSMGQGRTPQDAAHSFSAIFTDQLQEFPTINESARHVLQGDWVEGIVETTEVAARINALRQRIHEELGQASVEISFVPGQENGLHTVRIDNVDPASIARPSPTNEVV